MGLTLSLFSCTSPAHRAEQATQLAALREMQPISRPVAPAGTGDNWRDGLCPVQEDDTEVVPPKDSDLVRALENMEMRWQWVSGPRCSIQIKNRNGFSDLKSENLGLLYDLNDVVLDGSPAKTFLHTHEIIFWIKGSVVF